MVAARYRGNLLTVTLSLSNLSLWLCQQCRPYIHSLGKSQTLDKWYWILGHVNVWTIKTMHGNNLVLFDVWGLAQTKGPAWEKYFYSFTDTRSQYSAIYFGIAKDTALKNFVTFKEFIETQRGNKVKTFRSDNGGEYVNKPFKEFCVNHGIIMETTAPYSPSQNRIVKQLNWTLLEYARAMIFPKNLPKTLWPEAVAYANYIKNWSPMWVLGTKIMPYEIFFWKKPDVSQLEEFEMKCWVMVPDPLQRKLDPKAKDHIFVGIAEYTKAWKCYNIQFRHVQTSRNITFDKNDTKLFPIPNEDNDNVPLKGENIPHEWAPSPSTLQTDIAPTPRTILSPTPGLEVQQSTWLTNRPDYWFVKLADQTQEGTSRKDGWTNPDGFLRR